MRRWNSTFSVKTNATRLRRRRALVAKQKPSRAKPESAAEKRFKREVRERDNFTCQFPGCGSTENIDVHHIAKRSQRPDLKLVVSNGICLCRKHHTWTDFNHDEAVSMGLLSTESYELAKQRSSIEAIEKRFDSLHL